MDILAFLGAVPKIALFFLLIVGGAIVAEIAYFTKKKWPGTDSGPDLLSQEPVTQKLPENSTTIPPLPKLTTEEVVPPKTPRLNKKIITTALIFLTLAVSIPATVLLVKQRQEIRKGAQSCSDSGGACGNVGDLPCCGSLVCSYNTCKSCESIGVGECGTHVGCYVYDGGCHTNPPPGTPAPTPASGCGGLGQPAGCSCQTDSQCASGVCSFASCRGNDPTGGCAGFGASECATHVNCNWINNACVPLIGTPPPGSCSGIQKEYKGGAGCINETTATVQVRACIPSAVTESCSTSYSSASAFCPGADKAGCSGVCGVTPTTGTLTIPAGSLCSGWESTSCNSPTCGACQVDIDGHGERAWNDSTCASASPTPTPSSAMSCTLIKAYDLTWKQITNLTTLTSGQTIYLANTGTTTDTAGLTKSRFRINSGTWQETTIKHGNEFYIQYTIPAAGTFQVESMVYNPTLGWY